MPIAALRIDDAIWDAASPLRRDDWRLSILDLLDDASLGDEDDHLLHLSLAPSTVVFAIFDAEGAPRALHEVPREALRPQLEEYLTVIRRMHGEDTSESSARMQALDMAKKVVHDAGARALRGALPGFAPDHETYRRLFTLVLGLLVDVTALPGVQAHRRHL